MMFQAVKKMAVAVLNMIVQARKYPTVHTRKYFQEFDISHLNDEIFN